MKLDPFAQWGKVFEMWQKLTDDSIARATAFCAEVEKAEAKRVERAATAIEEIAKLQKETLAYGAQLGAELRKVSLDAFQKATALASTAATAAGESRSWRRAARTAEIVAAAPAPVRVPTAARQRPSRFVAASSSAEVYSQSER